MMKLDRAITPDYDKRHEVEIYKRLLEEGRKLQDAMRPMIEAMQLPAKESCDD